MANEMTWDEYFMGLAEMAASKSHCYSRQVGVVVVRDKIVLSTGYNGPAMGAPHCETRHPEGKKECPRRYAGIPSGQGLEQCPAVHAEANALFLAARVGHATKGATMYCYCTIPCIRCAVGIIQAGIKEVVCTGLEEYDPRPQAIKSIDQFNQTGVKVRVFETGNRPGRETIATNGDSFLLPSGAHLDKF